jgi:hypothetical protein
MRPVQIHGRRHARRFGQEFFLSPPGIADTSLCLPSILMPPGNIRYSKVAATLRKVRQVPQSGHNCPCHSFWSKLDYNPYLSMETLKKSAKYKKELDYNPYLFIVRAGKT